MTKDKRDMTEDKVVWNERKQTPEDIEKQKQFFMYCKYLKGELTLDDIFMESLLNCK